MVILMRATLENRDLLRETLARQVLVSIRFAVSESMPVTTRETPSSQIPCRHRAGNCV